MRSIFFASSLPKGAGYKEVFWVAVIVAVAYYAGYFTASALHFTGGYPQLVAFDGASLGLMCGTIVYFCVRRFSLWHSTVIGIGVTLFFRGVWGLDEWYSLLELIGGPLLVLRSFSAGPSTS